jgi:hypothetical protein
MSFLHSNGPQLGWGHVTLWYQSFWFNTGLVWAKEPV